MISPESDRAGNILAHQREASRLLLVEMPRLEAAGDVAGLRRAWAAYDHHKREA